METIKRQRNSKYSACDHMIIAQSVWNTVTPVRICRGQVRGTFLETVGGGVGTGSEVDELVGVGGRGGVRDLIVRMQPGLEWCTHQSRQ